jgi:hypothetical protein
MLGFCGDMVFAFWALCWFWGKGWWMGRRREGGKMVMCSCKPRSLLWLMFDSEKICKLEWVTMKLAEQG